METKRRRGIYELFVKRALDIILAGFAFIILSPLLAIVAIIARFKLGSPVVFKQARPGKDEKIFYLYKYRSMTNETDENGMLLPDSKRLTKFGKFLRKSSIDELLELWNIIVGDMSIVGPRPLSMYYLPHYSDEQRRRQSVRPGLTGLAQVNGRNNLSWDKRFEYDIEYVDNITFINDCKIIINTFFKVLKSADITVRGTHKVKDFGPYTVLKEEGRVTDKMNGMTYSEIGSFFWLDDNMPEATGKGVNWLPAAEDSAFTFSGRAAIEMAVRDILSNGSMNCIYMPSYCCVSMMQSFIDNGVKVKFYEVSRKDGRFKYELPALGAGDAVLVMDYFGLGTDAAAEAISKAHAAGAIVIEDITHSLLADEPACAESDYLVASLRKWFAVPAGGWVAKKSGKLAVKPDQCSDNAVEDKISGMKEKYAYLKGEISDKENFLATQSKFDNDLIHVDRLLEIDSTSYGIIEGTDVEAVKKQRRDNARRLCEGLEELNGAVLELPEMNLEKGTPLFLPVFLAEEDRNSLRKALIEAGMYCPVHWPEVMGANAGVRKNELSLVCDQRYSEGDMDAIVACIKQWYQNR